MMSRNEAYLCANILAMSEIKLSIDDQYLQAFLAFLQTLHYVQVEKVMPNGQVEKPKGEKPQPGTAAETFLAGLPPDSPLHHAVKPIRKSVTVEELIRESGYVRTDWEKVKAIGIAMEIPQSADELIAQLTP